ncbi:MAG TPA: hypothetical protein VH144_00375 [Candidatus Saccharimonadales bacterium]|jgi:hypothetical protein|nr:hypothetical protein [Candidatus Saccharimonadales bacterium]
MPGKVKKSAAIEKDSTYFLKLVIYIVLGTFWLKFHTPVHIGVFVLNGIPLGLAIGLIFAAHDHFQIDRKIEYAVLIVVAIISFFAPAGIVI